MYSKKHKQTRNQNIFNEPKTVLSWMKVSPPSLSCGSGPASRPLPPLAPRIDPGATRRPPSLRPSSPSTTGPFARTRKSSSALDLRDTTRAESENARNSTVFNDLNFWFGDYFTEGIIHYDDDICASRK